MLAPALLRPTAALRRLGVRWALAALLAATLMPTFARLAAATGPLDWAAICQAAPQAGSSQGEGDTHAPGDACALCSLFHTTPALAAPPAPAVAELAQVPLLPPAPEPVRGDAPQARAPGARAPPRSA